jgi:hypothetical protein
LFLAAVGLRLLGVSRMLKRSTGGKPGRVSPGAAQQVFATHALALKRGGYHGTCLTRSLALVWLLRGQGLAGELRIGVRREAGEFLAHAWVEHGGTPLNDAPGIARAFAAFDRLSLPSHMRWS